jgi:hypothetical protein
VQIDDREAREQRQQLGQDAGVQRLYDNVFVCVEVNQYAPPLRASCRSKRHAVTGPRDMWPLSCVTPAGPVRGLMAGVA